MSEERLTGDGLPELSEEEMGDPVEELRLLAETPSSGFLTRFRNTLWRRDLGSKIVGFGWGGLSAVFMEFLEIVFSVFDTTNRDEGGQR